MSSKYFLVILILQVAQISFADILIDTEDDLKGLTVSDTYFAAAADLPVSIPDEIRNSGSVGVWHYEEVRAGGVVILTLDDTTFTEISIKYYSSVKLSVYFQDQAQEAAELKVTFPATASNAWATRKFEVDRVQASSEALTFRIQFDDEEASKNGYFLLDSVNIVGTELVSPPTSTGPTGPTTDSSEEESTGSSTPADNGSAAIVPSILTFAVLAIFKTFM